MVKGVTPPELLARQMSELHLVLLKKLVKYKDSMERDLCHCGRYGVAVLFSHQCIKLHLELLFLSVCPSLWMVFQYLFSGGSNFHPNCICGWIIPIWFCAAIVPQLQKISMAVYKSHRNYLKTGRAKVEEHFDLRPVYKKENWEVTRLWCTSIYKERKYLMLEGKRFYN